MTWYLEVNEADGVDPVERFSSATINRMLLVELAEVLRQGKPVWLQPKADDECPYEWPWDDPEAWESIDEADRMQLQLSGYKPGYVPTGGVADA